MEIKKGLDIPITGGPTQTISEESAKITKVAVLGRDFQGLKPSMKVKQGDHVKIGEVLFTDKKNPGVNFTSPGAGVVVAVNRGAKRVLQSVVIELDENEESITSSHYTPEQLDTLDEAEVRRNLQESGAWTALRTRPYSKVPLIDAAPAAIFVTAMDTRPLAADPSLIINRKPDAFTDGLKLLSKLTRGKVFVCHKTGDELPQSKLSNVSYHDFSGVHPAGLVGTHIHFLMPAGESREVWHINYQDVIAFGRLFTTEKRHLDRIISLAGPMVKEPRLIRSRMGACTNEVVVDNILPESCRVISGSVLDGFRAAGWSAYLGRFSLQLSVVAEGQPREFLHWLNPFLSQFSVLRVFANSISTKKRFPMSSTQHGSPRAMVPLGTYEYVMPLDILPTQLLRALLVRDTETAKKLGCLELDEEDLALCTFVCHSKYEYGPALRACLETIERDG